MKWFYVWAAARAPPPHDAVYLKFPSAIIRSSFYMFPVSSASDFVFSLFVTDRRHQRKNSFQISCSAERDGNSCSTPAHFLLFSLFFPSVLYFLPCCTFAVAGAACFCYDINLKQGRKKKKQHNQDRLPQKPNPEKKKQIWAVFLLSQFISSVLPFWTPLALVSLTLSLSLSLSLRFHHPADYRHQRNTNRLHTDVSAQSSAGGVDTR